MNDPRQRALDSVLGGGSAGPTESVPPEVESDVGGGMKCPVCGAKFKLEAEAPEEGAEGPAMPMEGMGGM